MPDEHCPSLPSAAVAPSPESTGPAAATPLLPTISIVERSMGQARRSLALALGGATFILLAIQLDRLWFAAAHEAAALRHTQAVAVAGELRVLDQKLTSAAAMAVGTSSQHWVAVHDALLPQMDDALNQAKTLAPAGMSLRFEALTQSAKEELAGMRESAFEAIAVKATAEAQRIFESERYASNALRLQRSIEDFTLDTVRAAQVDLLAVQQRSLMLSGAVMLLALITGCLLWRGLSTRLARSREYFLAAEDRMQRLASSDLLTGLANRAALHDAMATAMARAEAKAHRLAVLMIDLDHFKPVNDTHGHMVGDLVLKEVALRLRQGLSHQELVARYGGDEFVVAVELPPDAADAIALARGLVQALRQPIVLRGISVTIGATVGIAHFPQDGRTEDELFRNADAALYRAKANGRGQVHEYDPLRDDTQARRAALEQAMREGIRLGQFLPYYQPIVDLRSREVQSLELLCRWHHPTQGLMPPTAFIGLAEEFGLIGPLMFSMLRHACAELARFPNTWRVSINLAPQQILDTELVPTLLQLLREFRVAPTRLDVELTESALVSHTARARDTMQALKAAGITVTLDDFGTGYSNLSYLAETDIDGIKIDRSFVHSLHDKAESAKIVAAVIGLSRSLGAKTVAEGVESERDARTLLHLGCRLGQGFLFGEPMPAEALMAMIEQAEPA